MFPSRLTMQRSIQQTMMTIRACQRNTYFQRVTQRNYHHHHFYNNKQTYQHIQTNKYDYSFIALLGVLQMGITLHKVLNNEKHTFCEEVVFKEVDQDETLSSSSSAHRQQQQEEEQNELGLYNYYYQKINNQHVIENDELWNESHAMFGALMKEGLIERYDTYKVVPMTIPLQTKNSEIDDTKASKKHEILLASVRVGKGLNGHKGIVHGGIISLLFDETFGWSFEAMPSDATNVSGRTNEHDDTIVVTANLNINYRHPLPAETDVVIRVYLDKVVGRKIYLSARMESRDGKLLYSDSTVLFVRIKMNALNKR